MDNKINNGDTELNNKGLPTELYGLEECIQQAFIRITVKKGSFPYNRELGSRLHTLASGADKERLLAYGQEALSGSGITASGVELTGGKMVFTLSTPFGAGQVEIAVTEGSDSVG